jgi:murein DD-endopeptidase MepM/ murein hydrolase activator NlpD
VKKTSCILFFILFLCFTGCAKIQIGSSGHYVYLKRNSSLNEVAKIYKVSESILAANNNHKEFVQGEWVYIPMERGIIGNRVYEEAVIQSDEVTDAYLNAGEFIWPVPAGLIISSGVGIRWGKRHEGIDIPGPLGSSILASAEGIVQYAGDDYKGYGNLIILKHKDGLFSLYAHSKINLVRSGQRVLKGQLIAKLGSTGHSTGPHLHFEIRKNGRVLDPKKMLAINLK